jgi:hypothetical protein
MEIKILPQIPRDWAWKKPLEEYETTLLSTGFSRFNTKTRVLSSIVREGDRILYSETPWESGVLSRCYAAEPVRMVVYSKTPAVWAEILSPEDVYFFQQQVSSTASTS